MKGDAIDVVAFIFIYALGFIAGILYDKLKIKKDEGIKKL